MCHITILYWSKNSVINNFILNCSLLCKSIIFPLVELVLFVLQVSYIRFHLIQKNNVRLISVWYSDAIVAFFKLEVSSLKGLCAVFYSMNLIVPTHGPVSYLLELNRRRTNPEWYCLPSWNVAANLISSLKKYDQAISNRNKYIP